ncbi:uncharacterized protein LOC129612942 [Condylostylus longicornis]|uniref:uncharacterized protein LOC129612942 n=1 Tax=Condylostylus longicornis TaxID=2530218 RepID=UPI00244E2FA9|nr:uncharacterized protein LOC129612942 [Condylostylus longicornis]
MKAFKIIFFLTFLFSMKYCLNTPVAIMNITEGKKIILKCEFNITENKNDDLTISWKHPDRIDNTRFETGTNYKDKILISFMKITNVTKSNDGGLYYCTLNSANNTDDKLLLQKYFFLKFDTDDNVENIELPGHHKFFEIISILFIKLFFIIVLYITLIACYDLNKKVINLRKHQQDYSIGSTRSLVV